MIWIFLTTTLALLSMLMLIVMVLWKWDWLFSVATLISGPSYRGGRVNAQHLISTAIIIIATTIAMFNETAFMKSWPWPPLRLSPSSPSAGACMVLHAQEVGSNYWQCAPTTWKHDPHPRPILTIITTAIITTTIIITTITTTFINTTTNITTSIIIST